MFTNRRWNWMTLAMVPFVGAACSNLLGVDDFSEASTRADTAEDRDGEGGSPGSGGSTGTAGGTPTTAGTQAWARAFGAASSEDRGCTVLTSSQDEVIMTGTIGGIVDFGGGTLGDGDERVFLARMTADGEHVSSGASSGTAEVELTDAAIDLADNVILAGSFEDGTLTIVEGADEITAVPADGHDLFVAKVTPDGEQVWSNTYAGTGDQRILAVATDPNDGAVVGVGTLSGSVTIGSTELTSNGGDNIIVVRWGAAGTPDEDVVLSLGDGGSASADAVTVDDSGDIWVAGTFSGTIDVGGDELASVGLRDMFLLRISGADGSVELTSRFGSGGSFTVGDLMPLDGGVLVVGAFSVNASFGGEPLEADAATATPTEDMFVVSLDDGGAQRFARSFGGPGDDLAHSVMPDSNGNVVVGGSFTSSIDELGVTIGHGQDDAVVFKLDPTGEPIWVIPFGRNGGDVVGSVAVDSDDAVLVTGKFEDSFTLGADVVFGSGLEDIFLAKLLP